MVNVTSNVKLSSSGNVPTTGTLQKGYLSFGNFGGKNKLYGNVGSEVADLIGDAKTVLYFQNQSELDTFLQGTDVPVGEWYAAVADTVYEQYREWVAYKINLLDLSLSSRAAELSLIGNGINGLSFYNYQDDVDFGTGLVGTQIQFGNYAHTRYFINLNYRYSTSQWAGLMNFKQDPTASEYSVDFRDMENIDIMTDTHMEANMQNYTANPQVAPEDNTSMYLSFSSAAGGNSVAGYLVMKEILSDGEPWIDWEEIKAMEANNG